MSASFIAVNGNEWQPFYSEKFMAEIQFHMGELN